MREDVRFGITIDGFPGDPFAVVGFVGEEALSALYRFDVTLHAGTAEPDPAALVGAAAHLELSTFGQTRRVHGLLAEARYAGEGMGGGSFYRVRLVPRLWRLTQTRQNRICGTAEPVTVPGIVAADLEAAGLSGVAATPGATPDFRLDLHGSYPARDHVVQYGETDFAFVSRLMESRGIFYLFDGSASRDLLVLADHDAAFADIEDAAELVFRDAGGMVHDAPSIAALDIVRRVLPARVILRDYNYRLPHVTMQAEAQVDPAGHGVVERYGDHFRTPEEGAGLARIRADALLCRRETLTALSDCVGVAAGRRFRLTDHPAAACNGRRFLVERVVHEGWDPRFGGRPPDGATLIDAGAGGYANRLEALDASLSYRPEERTARPVAAGLTHARIDGAGDGLRAELDDQGRYKVRVPYDLSGAAGGAASRWVRMMQPYGGSTQGMHLPLLQGTEVVMGAVGGDPDRPVILGAVPNPSAPSLVTNANATRNRLRTTSGVELELNDGTVTGGGDDTASSSLGVEQQASSSDVLSESTGSSGSWAKLSVPDYDGTSSSGTDSYLRIGAADSDSECDYVDGIAAVVGDDYDFDGLLAFTSGNETRVVAGMAADSVGGDVTCVIDGSVTDSVAGSRTTTIGYGDADSPGGDTLSVAGDRDVTISGDLVESVAGARSVSIAGSYTTDVAADRTDSVDGALDQSLRGYELVVSGSYSETRDADGYNVVESFRVDTTRGVYVAIYHSGLTKYSLSFELEILAGVDINIAALGMASSFFFIRAYLFHYKYATFQVDLGIYHIINEMVVIEEIPVNVQSGPVEVQTGLEVDA